jgi:hypothetical protein
MTAIVLSTKAADGEILQATYLPEKGMNLISYKKGDLEVIDQTTRNLFEERYAGLGALIGPHFYHRRTELLPKIADESLFPHIARVKAKGTAEPFSHGIARYAPWKATSTDTTVTAILTGKDTWNGVPLSALEGQNFTMRYEAALKPTGLHIEISVVSDTDSLVGIHYYYRLANESGKVISAVQPEYIDHEALKAIPASWQYDSQNVLTFDLKEDADYTFHPYPNPLEGKITLDAGDYTLITTYNCNSQENSWQLYHPKGASFVCIEPISSQDPRHANLTVSSLQINLEIEKKFPKPLAG